MEVIKMDKKEVTITLTGEEYSTICNLSEELNKIKKELYDVKKSSECEIMISLYDHRLYHTFIPHYLTEFHIDIKNNDIQEKFESIKESINKYILENVTNQNISELEKLEKNMRDDLNSEYNEKINRIPKFIRYLFKIKNK